MCWEWKGKIYGAERGSYTTLWQFCSHFLEWPHLESIYGHIHRWCPKLLRREAFVCPCPKTLVKRLEKGSTHLKGEHIERISSVFVMFCGDIGFQKE